ncbi:MAG: hypothetical protein GC184_03955 [Rhizobiales bacterium]|nr:hypothetical protein [Hyphomicrobiales bacterium]
MKPTLQKQFWIAGPSLQSPRPMMHAELGHVRESEETLKEREARLHHILAQCRPSGADFFEPDLPTRPASDAPLTTGRLIAGMVVTLQRWIGFPVSHWAVVSTRETAETIAIEYAVKPVTINALALALHLYELSDPGIPHADRQAAKAIGQFTAKSMDLRNVATYLRLARRLNIPWRDLRQDGHFLSFGEGHLAQRVYGNFTDRTSTISASLSTNKNAAARILQSHGIPAPHQHVVATLEAAIQAARALGYPVVIKPLGTDKGTAVSTGLMNEAAVKQAYNAARAHGPVLVETHLPGEHYRLTVIDGKLHTARHQIPAHVIGDGKTDITGLVAGANRARAGQNLWPIQLDQMTDDFIKNAGLTRTSIPVDEQKVALRSQSNLVLGGSYEIVTDIMHPDNKWLAERATHVMGIDVAGLDFLCPDIAKSYLEVGGGFCEINVTPAFMFDEREYLFDKWFPGPHQGRILTIGILNDGGTIASEIAAQMLQTHPHFSWASKQGFYVDGSLAAKEPQDNFAGTQRAWSEPSSTAALMELNTQDIARHGLGIDRLAVLVLVNKSDGDGPETAAATGLLKSLSSRVIEVTGPDDARKKLEALLTAPTN